MSPWSLVLVPLSLAFVFGLLALMSSIEQRVLSTPAFIRYTARSRHVGPDTVEILVAQETERLLRDMNRR